MERQLTTDGDVPAEVGAQRRVEQHHRHAADLVAVGVDARHQRFQHLFDGGRRVIRVCQLASLGSKRGPQSVIEHRVDEAGLGRGRGEGRAEWGKPIAALVRPRPVAARAASGNGCWAGGHVPRITQLRKCTRMALTVSVVRQRIGGQRRRRPSCCRGSSRQFWAGATPGRLVSKPPAATAVRGAGDVIAPHVVGHRNIFMRAGADPLGAELERPRFPQRQNAR